jgi:hypothetical protein
MEFFVRPPRRVPFDQCEQRLQSIAAQAVVAKECMLLNLEPLVGLFDLLNGLHHVANRFVRVNGHLWYLCWQRIDGQGCRRIVGDEP